MPGATVCLLCHQSGKGPGFFRLPSLKKYPYRRMAVIESARLPQDFMKTEGNFCICYRHYKLSDIRTDLKRLGLKRGSTYNSIHKYSDPVRHRIQAKTLSNNRTIPRFTRT